MKAVKGNKEYIIKEEQVKAYQEGGFDVKDDAGNVVAYGRGKTVSYGTYMEVLKEKEDFRKQIEELEKEKKDLQERLLAQEEAPGSGKRTGKKEGE